MDTSIAFRVDGNMQQMGGQSHQGDKERRRRQKLKALLECLKAGDLDSARQAFTALINFDPSVSGDPYLAKIGAALQSSNLYSARHFAKKLESPDFQLQSLIERSDTKDVRKQQAEDDPNNGFFRVDISA